MFTQTQSIVAIWKYLPLTLRISKIREHEGTDRIRTTTNALKVSVDE